MRAGGKHALVEMDAVLFWKRPAESSSQLFRITSGRICWKQSGELASRGEERPEQRLCCWNFRHCEIEGQSGTNLLYPDGQRHEGTSCSSSIFPRFLCFARQRSNH